MDIKSQRRINMQKLIRQCGTQVQFSRKVGTSPAYVSQILSEKTRGEIGEQFARQIEAAFELPKFWLDDDHAVMSRRYVPVLTAEEVVKIASGEKHVEKEDGQILWTDRNPSKNAFAFIMHNDEMEPLIPAGAALLVEPDVESLGRVVVIVANGVVFVRETGTGMSGNVILKPANTRLPIEPFTPDMEVVGTVLDSIVTVTTTFT